MICGVCIFVVEGGFNGVDGFFKFNISFLVEWVVIMYDVIKFMVEKIVELIEDCGFDVLVIFM